jgi:hypothetical protein
LAKSSSKQVLLEGRILALVQDNDFDVFGFADGNHPFSAETQQVVSVRKHKATHRIIQNANKQALQSLVMNPGRAVTLGVSRRSWQNARYALLGAVNCCKPSPNPFARNMRGLPSAANDEARAVGALTYSHAATRDCARRGDPPCQTLP